MTTTATEPDRMRSRRAIEALRAGVPSAHAVAALGSGQDEIEDRVTALLDSARAGDPGGLLLGGGFGSGKSHLLEHLSHLASAAGFVVSRVIISKETPLHDPVKVFRAAAEDASTTGRADGAIAQAAAELDVEGRGFVDLLSWADSHASGLNQRFPASLRLFARCRETDGELAEKLVRFWSGDPLGTPELRRRLREIGENGVVLPPVAARDLGVQRLRFVSRLLAAAGHAGWLVLFDEVELIGRYSLLQRARSYAEVARWVRGTHAPGSPLAAILAMTDDFEAAVISGRNDRDVVATKLRDRETSEAAELAALAEKGMQIIDREMILLTPPGAAELDRVYQRLKALHGEAFDWSPPDVASLERLGATRMRQYVRAWINEWDLIRLDPGFAPQTEFTPVISDYREEDVEPQSEW